MNMFIIVILSLASYASSTEQETETYPDLKPLPPDTFEYLFNNRYPNFMILDASRFWDTATQFKNFSFIQNTIQDESTDPQTRKYAQSLMSEATTRLKNSLRNYQLELDDKYDMFDFIREWKNVEDGKSPVHEDLYKMIETYFGLPRREK